MNNLIYLIFRYLEEEKIEFSRKFDALEGIDVIEWKTTNSNGFSAYFRIVVYEDDITATRYSGERLSFSEEIKTFAEFRQLLLLPNSDNYFIRSLE